MRRRRRNHYDTGRYFILPDGHGGEQRPILYSRLASPYLSDRLNKQTAAIKEVVSLLLLIRDSEGVELTADPDGVYYEAAGRFGVRLGTIMKGDKEDEITRSN